MTLCSCPGQQFYPNKRGRKYRKVLQLGAGGRNTCYQSSTVKGSSQAATAFPTSVHEHSFHREAAGKDTRSSFPRPAKCWCSGRTARSPGEGRHVSPRADQGKEPGSLQETFPFLPFRGKGFSDLFFADLLGTSLRSSAIGRSHCRPYRKG